MLPRPLPVVAPPRLLHRRRLTTEEKMHKIDEFLDVNSPTLADIPRQEAVPDASGGSQGTTGQTRIESAAEKPLADILGGWI